MQSTIDGRRKWLVLLLIAAFVVSLSALTAFWFAHRVDKSAHSRVSSNSVSDATLTDLRVRAQGGDNAARMELHLLSGGTDEGRAMLDAAVASGYGPAIVVQFRRMGGDPASTSFSSTHASVEKIATGGSLSAAVELRDCKRSGYCGSGSIAESYRWAVMAMYVANSLSTDSRATEAEQREIASRLDEKQRRAIETEVEKIVRSPSFRPQD